MPQGVYLHKPHQLFQKGHKINVGRKFSEEIKRKWSKMRKGKQSHMFGRKLTKKWKESISKTLKGKYIGPKNSQWKGGRISDGRGYILIYAPNHPFANYHGYIREHRLIIEKFLGRFLNNTEYIHHINHNRSDNRIKNLLLCDRKNHSNLHRSSKTGQFISY